MSQKCKLLKGQSWWKNRFQKQSFVDFKLDVLKHFVNPTGNHLCWSLFSIKFAGLKVCNSIKKRLQHSCLPGKFANFLRTPFSQNNFRGYFWGVSLLFSNIGATVSNKYHVQLQKSIYCSEKSEGATICILFKKTCNFIRKRLQYCEVYKNTRGSHQRRSIIKGVLINFAKFTGKHLCQSLFLNKGLWFAQVCLLFL